MSISARTFRPHYLLRPSLLISSSLLHPTTTTTQSLARRYLFVKSSIPNNPKNMSLPSVQTAVQINAYGGLEVIELNSAAPVPAVGNDEVLVKNEYVGINYIDNYFRAGVYKAPGFPYTLGREGEGRVVAVGSNVSAFKVGHKVAYVGGSAQAEYTAVNSTYVAHIPSGVPEGIAAASMIQGLTALTMVRDSYEVKKGDYILVHAAAGGVGLWLCQILRHIGAHTIATASTPEKLSLAKANGASFVIDYTREDWAARVLEITHNEGVHAIFDGVGASTFDKGLEVLRRKGTFVSFGNASGVVPPVAIARLSAKNLKLLRTSVFGYIATREEFEQYTGEMFNLIAHGKVDVKIHEIYPFKDVTRAMKDIESRKTTGKLLLKL